MLSLPNYGTLATWKRGVAADRQWLVAHREHLIGAAGGVVPPRLLLSVGLFLEMLPLLFTASGAYRLPMWLRACPKVAIVYVLKVFGHRVLIVAVDSVFLLRSVGVISILQEIVGIRGERQGRGLG